MTEQSAWYVLCMASSHVYDINVSLRISRRVLQLSDCNALTYIFLKILK